MNKDIKYTSYSAVPSDYECPDGLLSSSLNLISDDDALHPLQPAPVILNTPASLRILFIHKISASITNYIAVDTASGKLLFLDTDGNTRPFITQPPAIPSSIRAVGMTLLLIIPHRPVCYYIWRDGAYSFLGDHLPSLTIQFGLRRWGSLGSSVPIQFPVPEEYREAFSGSSSTHPSASGTSASEAREKFTSLLTDAIYAQLNKRINDLTDEKGLLFLHPFFVRYALRLFDGSYISHSAPVLMLPSSVPPWIASQGNADIADGIYTDVLDFTDVNLFRLVYRTFDTDNLRSFKDIISSLDIFISQPLYTYDASKSVGLASRNISYDTHSGTAERGRGGGVVPSADTVSASRLDGIYAASDGVFRPHLASPPSTAKYFTLPFRERDLNADIQSCANFYLAASIPFDKIKSSPDNIDVTFDEGVSFNTLPTRRSLPDDFLSRSALIPSGAVDYNNRAHLFGCTVLPPVPFPVRTCLPMSNPSGFDPVTSFTVSTCVHLRKNGTEIRVTDVRAIPSDIAASPFTADSITDCLPLFLFYPDPDAYAIDFRFTNCASGLQSYVSFPLATHDFLHGAFHFRGLAVPADSSGSLSTVHAWDSPDTSSRPGYDRLSTIYVSEVNNPFIFPAQYAVSVGVARVTALTSAARALSQGQFGQFPLYAFTSEGVWALEVASGGAYIARQPITRDVLLDGTLPLQMDGSVLFATARGIMHISGSQTQCISDAINSPTPFDLRLLPGIDKLHAMTGHNIDTCLPTAPFLHFLSSAAMIYDYVHQRVIVFNPGYSYAYVFSLKSRNWAMIHSTISYAINSYPDAFAVDHDGALLNFSADSSDDVRGLLVTRPLKLDAPDVLKTIDTIIQRGNFRRGHVQSVLYGSRDLQNWHLVWSSKDHCLRGFRGTPYKYFRIALLCNLSPDESIFGASVQFTPKLTNQPR